MTKTRIVKCPTCGKENLWDDDPRGPFCSKRCQLIDLGRWLDGDFSIEGNEMDEIDSDVLEHNRGRYN